ncbi:MAG: nickel-dependent hydrogenase large subunit, partial [Coriobacteriales bacterium]|nr:nickel-dependent hydrogenase large subunit [Coriobacteriales bacterium]
DPITRIEGHLRIEMEFEGGVVKNAWASGGLFRGMELILEGREPGDACYVAQRICGVCPVSHCHASCFAGEGAYGIQIPNNARIIRNLLEGAQFLHSHILWFYNLTGLDYVNPINALKADIADTAALGLESIKNSTPLVKALMPDWNFADTQVADFAGVKNRLEAFAANGQLSIFSGNWFDSGAGDEYKLPPELDLIATTHYLEALQMQAKASQISGILGGKMPHVMASVPGGTTFYPTEQRLDDVLFRAIEIRDWVAGTLIPDTLAVAPFYMDDFGYGRGYGKTVAWGVFDAPSRKPEDRYLPAGIVDMNKLTCKMWDEKLITEDTTHAYYDDAAGTEANPRQGITAPAWPSDGYNVNNKYSWSKSPRYEGEPLEAGPLSRVLSAYLQGNAFFKKAVDAVLQYLGVPGRVDVLVSTMGRVAARNIECLYVANLMIDWINELCAALKGGDTEFFAEPETTTGEGAGMWEAPRGAIYHYEKIKNNKIQKYQIIIPTTWNVGPRDKNGTPGPIEQALIGVPVNDMNKPIQALRTVHSFDPCIACAVHITEPKTGKKFTTVTSPWGVR